MTLAAALVFALVAQAPPADAAAPSAAASPPAAPPAPERCKIVVLNLVGRSLPPADKDLPALLTETLASEVETASGCGVVSQADIVSMLDYEKQKAVCSDGSDSCLAEIGQALGADRVVAGTVGKLGAETILTARLMNVKKGVVEQRAEQTVQGAPEKLRRAAKNVGRRLFGVADLPDDAKVDDTPLSSGASSGGGALVWTGVVVGGAGVVAVAVGGTLAVLAENQLADPHVSGKNKTEAHDEGLIALGVAGAGALVGVGGAVVALVSME